MECARAGAKGVIFLLGEMCRAESFWKVVYLYTKVERAGDERTKKGAPDGEFRRLSTIALLGLLSCCSSEEGKQVGYAAIMASGRRRKRVGQLS